MGLGVARGRRNGALPGADASRRNGGRASVRGAGHAPVGSVVRLAGMRLTHQWRLLLAVALGILVAVVLICTVPLYNTLVADVELQRVLSIAQPAERNIDASVQSQRVNAAAGAAAQAQVLALGRKYLAGFTAPAITSSAESAQMLILRLPDYVFQPANSNTPRVVFQAIDFTAAAPHMTFLSGGPPQDSSQAPQVIVTLEMATDHGLHVGSTFEVTQFGDHRRTVTLVVSGIWQPTDVNDPYWNGRSFEARSGKESSDVYPVQLPISTFYSQLAPFDQVSMMQHLVYYTRPAAITITNMDGIADGIASFRAHMNGDVQPQPGVEAVGVATALDHDIQDIRAQQTLLVLPLYVIVAQVVGLALLFVIAMAGLLIEGQSQEIATLKSRGASGWQILGTFTAQSALLALLAAVAGPFIAVLLALALTRWFVPASLQYGGGAHSNYLTGVAQPQSVVVPAIIGALLGVAAVAFSALQSARLDVLAFRREQGRASRQPLWRRYYLDLLLAVLCVAGYVELGQFGGVATRAELGSQATSPLLLVAPALLLLAGSLLVLRVFPLGAGLGARLAARRRGMTSLLAFSQVERSPARYTRMTLLLMLAVGLGLFALTFDTSLQQNVRDRVAYSVGADVRLGQSAGLGNGFDAVQEQRLLKLPGVLGLTPAYRSRADATALAQGGAQVDVLGIDPATFYQQAGVISWRGDYADQPLPALLSSMRANSHPTDAGTRSSPVWTLVSDAFASTHHVKRGDRFVLSISETSFSSTAFEVGDIVSAFPTLYPTRVSGSFIVVDMADYFAAIKASSTSNDYSLIGPNEFWLRTTADPGQHAALLAALRAPDLDAQNVVSRSDQLAAAQLNPVASGMRGLLLIGAVTAALLAVIGSMAQSVLAARQRATQFAVLRTIGMVSRQLTGLLLGEQIVVYLFGLLGGTALGLLLATATLPFLEFSDTTVDPVKLGIPPYVLAFNGGGIAIFYAALLAAFLLALAIAARYAATIGLGKALRLGED